MKLSLPVISLLTLILSAHVASAQDDSIGKAYIYVNTNDFVVKVNGEIIPEKDFLPLELTYGSHYFEASALGRHTLYDTILINEPVTIVRLKLEKTPAYKAYQDEMLRYRSEGFAAYTTAASMVVIGTVGYFQFNKKEVEFESLKAEAKAQTLHFKEKYEGAVALNNVEVYRAEFENWRDKHSEVVDDYNDFLSGSRLTFGVLAGGALISGYLLYKHREKEKPVFSGTSESLRSRISISPFQNQFNDAGFSLVFRF